MSQRIIPPWLAESTVSAEPTRALIYCDESGNSGPNYIDPGQPFYVLASWVVPYDNVAEVAAAVELHRQQYSPESPELKAKNLLRRDRGKRGIVSLFQRLGRLGCVPVYVLTEKRYCIAAKAIETFLDPLYNPLLANPFIGDRETKQQIANLLHEHLPVEVLNGFADAYRHPSEMKLGESLTALAAAIKENIGDELAELFEGSREQLGDIAKAEANLGDFDQPMSALNLPALVSMLMMIDRLARQGLCRPLRFVHDEIHAYERDYKKWYAILRGAKDCVIEYPDDDDDLRPRALQNIPAFEMASSQDNQMIQAADVLAGTVARLARNANLAHKVTSMDRDLAWPLLSTILLDEPKIAWWLASDEWIRAIGRSYFRQSGKAAQRSGGPQRLSQSLIPRVRGRTEANDAEERRFALDLPLFGLVTKETGQLICVPDIDIQDAPPTFDGVATLLFTSEQRAADALAVLASWNEAELPEAMEIRRFGARLKEVFELIELLDGVAGSASVVGIDVFSSREPVYSELRDLVNGMSQSVGRVLCAVRSGTHRVLGKTHETAHGKVFSWLAANGEYLATSRSTGVIGRGASREEAVAAASSAVKTEASQGPPL